MFGMPPSKNSFNRSASEIAPHRQLESIGVVRAPAQFQRYALALCWEITVELSSIPYRSNPKEVKENVLFILRCSGRAGLKLL